MLLSGNVSRSYHPLNGSMGLKIDTTPFVMFPHRLPEFYENQAKELIKNAEGTRFEENFGSQHSPPFQSTNWLENFKNTIFHSNSSTCLVSAKSVVEHFSKTLKCVTPS